MCCTPVFQTNKQLAGWVSWLMDKYQRGTYIINHIFGLKITVLMIRVLEGLKCVWTVSLSRKLWHIMLHLSLLTVTLNTLQKRASTLTGDESHDVKWDMSLKPWSFIGSNFPALFSCPHLGPSSWLGVAFGFLISPPTLLSFIVQSRPKATALLR